MIAHARSHIFDEKAHRNNYYYSNGTSLGKMKICVADIRDTLRKIAVRYRIHLDQLININSHIPSPDLNISGKNVYLPSEPLLVGKQSMFPPNCPPEAPTNAEHWSAFCLLWGQQNPHLQPSLWLFEQLTIS